MPYTMAVPSDEWWNLDWNYRIKLDINATNYSRTNWTIERDINFSEHIIDTFDINSVRVIEYGDTTFLHEVASQFDVRNNYSAAANAIGTVIFRMNDTTAANTTRSFYIYFDSVENGVKPASSYETNITYVWDGQILTVNNTRMRFFIDTNRLDNTSGIYRVQDEFDNVILNALSNQRTAEYNEYTNSTHNFSFNLINNMSIINGSLRFTGEQQGEEIIFGDPLSPTGSARITKRYRIYDRFGGEAFGVFIKIEQEIENIGVTTINRNSTLSGALAFDVNRTFGSGLGVDDFLGTRNEPYSYYEAGDVGGFVIALTNLNSSDNYTASNTSTRIGMELSNSTLAPGDKITQTSLVYFGTGGSPAVTEFLGLRDRFINPVNIIESSSESWVVNIDAITNATIYNKNETVVITADLILGDLINLTIYVNATLDMGTAETTDDVIIQLFDDGNGEDQISNDRIFTGLYNISLTDNVSQWVINISTYNITFGFLNSNLTQFNVTDELNLTVQIDNPIGPLNRRVLGSFYVQNFRRDIYIPSAQVDCVYNGTSVANITDLNNGTYAFNFTAPSVIGAYTLNCNATNANNTGFSSDNFVAETPTVNISILFSTYSVNITNVGLFQNDSFQIQVNATNIRNGTAYDVNISLILYPGWSSNISQYSCGSINAFESCIRNYNITAPANTVPGEYEINATIVWRNPDDTTSFNETRLLVNVTENSEIETIHSIVSGKGADGTTINVANVTILSVGNYQLENISFGCIGGPVCTNFTITFDPHNITNMSIGTNITVKINAAIPLNYVPGVYNGTINITTNVTNMRSFLFILEINITNKTAIDFIFDPSSYTSTTITVADNDTFQLTSNVTNIGFSNARFVNISISIPQNWSSNTSFYFCPNISKNDVCSRDFDVTIPNTTLPGNYTINVTVNWTDNDNVVNTNSTLFDVVVASNPVINISHSSVARNVSVNITNVVNFTLFSIGNDALQNVAFVCDSGIVCQNFTVIFTPANFATMLENTNSTVNISITIPDIFPEGNYSGIINVSTDNIATFQFNLNLTVLPSRRWSIVPTFCQKSLDPEEGTACIINITNTGNTIINFTINPTSENHSTVNETNFTIPKGETHSIEVLYNVTGFSQSIFNTTFTVTSLQTATPQISNFNVTLLPFTPPIINITIIPNITEQNSDVDIRVNITDISSAGINFAIVNITLPNGTIDIFNLTLVETDGSITRWRLLYPNGTRNTTQLGLYNVTVITEDNIGNVGSEQTNFTVHTNLVIAAKTLSNTYFQSDIGTIFYSVRNVTNAGIADVTVNITIFDQNNSILYLSNIVTDSDGTIIPLPTFTLASDALIGNYTLNVTSTWYDSVVNITIQKNTTYNFTVSTKTINVAGLFADISTGVVWFPSNTMTFGILFHDGEGSPTDPNFGTLQVLDPALNPYFTANLTAFTKQSTGFYIYQFAMPVNTASGMYLAILNATQGNLETIEIDAFRVSQGGPFDVIVNLLEHEVPRNDFLDFTITIENKGEVSQDVQVEYWVESQGTRYFEASEFVLAPAFTNQSFTRNAFIFSDQPFGNYLLNARVTFSAVQPSLTSNESFVVVALAATPTPTPEPSGAGSGGGGGVSTVTGTTGLVIKEGVSEPISVIIIEKFNNNITLAKGMIRIENVIVKNIGKTDLNNLTLLLTGIPASWYSITPEKYDFSFPSGSHVFLLEFNIPEDADLGAYPGILIASTNRASDQKSIVVNIFESIDEVLTKDLDNLEDDLNQLIIDTQVSKRLGIDVSNVEILIEEIKDEIAKGRNNIKTDTDEALVNIGNTRNMLQRARNLLATLDAPLQPAAFNLIPIIIGLVILVILIVIIIFILKKNKKTAEKINPYINNLMKIVKQKRVNKDFMNRENDKLTRMMTILEKERKEGIISGHAYEEMKKSMESKKMKIERKLISVVKHDEKMSKK